MMRHRLEKVSQLGRTPVRDGPERIDLAVRGAWSASRASIRPAHQGPTDD
jgi:hypothetical protein